MVYRPYQNGQKSIFDEINRTCFHGKRRHDARPRDLISKSILLLEATKRFEKSH
jgi:hypothetical protein